MILERNLANFAGAVNIYRAASEQLQKHNDELIEREKHAPPIDVLEVGLRLVEGWKAENAEAAARRAVERAEFAAGVSHKRAVQDIGELLPMLGAIADRSINRLPFAGWTFPRISMRAFFVPFMRLKPGYFDESTRLPPEGK